MMMPMIAGTRIPFDPCLETPNKATTLKTNPRTMSKSATCTMIGIIFRATICLSNIKSAKTMRLMTGQTQPSFAARCENDVVFGVVGVFISGGSIPFAVHAAEVPVVRAHRWRDQVFIEESGERRRRRWWRALGLGWLQAGEHESASQKGIVVGFHLVVRFGSAQFRGCLWFCKELSRGNTPLTSDCSDEARCRWAASPRSPAKTGSGR